MLVAGIVCLQRKILPETPQKQAPHHCAPPARRWGPQFRRDPSSAEPSWCVSISTRTKTPMTPCRPF
ncbi:hypothetical protein T484DRAFT_1952068 [Baffinella frigidus]|nr:hypothetical protein T484DRAFT_1952068 [Cryptophyta sp. CCMP2293]